MLKKTLAMIACLGGLRGSEILAQEPEPAPVISIRWIHPDRQLEEVLQLFKGTRAASPAAALAGWKRASKEPNRLGKPLEALIASLNPKMVGELKALDEVTVSIRFLPESGEPEWSALLPKDDGTFSALATAFVLSGGAAEAPMGEIAVDRLAGPGSPLMAKVPGGTLLAGDRDGLKAAISRLKLPTDLLDELLFEDGLQFELEPGSLKNSRSLALRRFAELIRPPVAPVGRSRSVMVVGNATLDGGIFSATILGAGLPPLPRLSIDPSWFDWTPKNRVLLSFAFATDPSGKSWDSLFELADRIEKLDPTRAEVASLQVRLGLLARLAGLRLETDLLRHLQGVSGWVGSDEKVIDSAMLLLHLDDQAAAERVVAGLKPLPGSEVRPAGERDRPRWLGQVENRALRITRSDRVILIGWGDDAIPASLKARDDPDLSAGPEMRMLPLKDRTAFRGLVWPDRVPGVGSQALRSRKNLVEATPMIWQVIPSGKSGLSLTLIWPGIDQWVKNFLESIPLDPPPDH